MVRVCAGVQFGVQRSRARRRGTGAASVNDERAGAVRYQAIVRRVQPGGGLLNIKRSFSTKSAASSWAARIEGDARTARDLGSPGAVMKLSELAEKYEQAGGKKGFRYERWVSTDRSLGGL